MKAFLGTIVFAMGVAGFVMCPSHIKAEAAEGVQIPEDTADELARQFDVFTEYMRGETPDFDPDARIETSSGR
tara:strand:+ start:819 stop:1037 length:219 start_codon:yes stop_codon:yes gene_type:complete